MKITNHDGCGKIMLGDSADETNEILNCIQRQDIYAIPPKSNTRNPWHCDYVLYMELYLEAQVCSTYCNKSAFSFLAFIYMVSILLKHSTTADFSVTF